MKKIVLLIPFIPLLLSCYEGWGWPAPYYAKLEIGEEELSVAANTLLGIDVLVYDSENEVPLNGITVEFLVIGNEDAYFVPEDAILMGEYPTDNPDAWPEEYSDDYYDLTSVDDSYKADIYYGVTGDNGVARCYLYVEELPIDVESEDTKDFYVYVSIGVDSTYIKLSPSE